MIVYIKQISIYYCNNDFVQNIHIIDFIVLMSYKIVHIATAVS